MKNCFYKNFLIAFGCCALISNSFAKVQKNKVKSETVKHKKTKSVTVPTTAFDNKILVVVNGDIITKLDVLNKMKLFMRLANLEIPESEAKEIFRNMLLSMVDETLKLQKVTEFIKRFNDNTPLVTIEDLNAYLEQVLKNNKISKEEFHNFLKKNNIPLAFVYKQIDANLSWNRFIVERFGANVQISDAEVASFINQLEAGNRYKTYTLGRIMVPFTKDTEQEAHKKISEAVYYLKQGVAFELVANNFSSGAEAPNGGFIGPVKENQLSDQEKSALSGLTTGNYSEILRGDNEFIVYKVYTIKKQGENFMTKIVAQRVEFTAPREQLEAVAAEVLANASNADKFMLSASLDKRARISNDETFIVEEMRPEVQGFMSGLTAGTISAPVPTPNGFTVFYTKSKEKISDKIPSFKEVKYMIHTRKLESIARKQFQEAKANAYIKYVNN